MPGDLSCGIRVRTSNTGTLRYVPKNKMCRTSLPYHGRTSKFDGNFGWTVSPGATVSKYVDSIKAPSSVYDILDTWGRPLADRRNTTNGTSITTDGTLKGFWNCFGATCPNLQQLANKVFKQPVSQSAVEQLFSQYDYVMAARRNRLSPRTQERLMFTKINLVI